MCGLALAYCKKCSAMYWLTLRNLVCNSGHNICEFCSCEMKVGHMSASKHIALKQERRIVLVLPHYPEDGLESAWKFWFMYICAHGPQETGQQAHQCQRGQWKWSHSLLNSVNPGGEHMNRAGVSSAKSLECLFFIATILKRLPAPEVNIPNTLLSGIARATSETLSLTPSPSLDLKRKRRMK